MAQINMSLMSKGGVGKSFVATLLAQHFLRQGKQPICFDTDTLNQTFAGYKGLGVKTLKLGEKVDEINPRNFDKLMEDILVSNEDDVFIIDNGSSTYLPLISYMIENQALTLLEESGHHVVFHTVLTGGQAYEDTHEGLESLFTHFPATQHVIWLNEYFGPVEKNGKDFEQTNLCKKNEDKITALLSLPQVRKATFGEDIEAMMKAHLTFDEALQNPDFSIMTRQRLTTFSKAIFKSMEEAQL